MSTFAGGAIPLGYTSAHAHTRIGFSPRTAELSSLGAEDQDLIVDEGEGHLMTFAPTGAGKGVSCAIPTLLSYTGSAVVLDPKGELAAVTGPARRAMGQQVVILDPFKIVRGRRGTFNPLDLINEAQSFDDCMTLAAAIAHDIGVKDPFWDERARQLITQILLYIAQESPAALQNIHEAWFLLNQNRKEFELTVRAMQQSKSPSVRAGVGMITTAEPKVLASILSSAQRFLEPFRSPSVKASTAGTTFDVAAFSEGQPHAIYLVLPPERLVSHAAVLRFWITGLLLMVLRRRHKLAQSTLFLIDEAAQLGRLEGLVTAMTLLRGYGVKVWTFWQDPQQLEATYPREWRTMFNNCATHSTFGRMTPMARETTAKLFAFPERKLQDLGRRQALLMKDGERTQIIRRVDYRSEPELRHAAQPNPHFEDACKQKPVVRVTAAFERDQTC